MQDSLSPADTAKRAAAARALNFVEHGMTIGLGTGSTADWMVRLLAERISGEGLAVIGVPTSTRTAAQAAALGIPLTTLDDAGWLDLTIDGADEFDANLRLIKGGGGALLQEKIVATASDRMVVIADPSKQVATLGAFPLPVEVVRFGAATTSRLVRQVLADHGLGEAKIAFREGDMGAMVTDEGHHILDLHLGAIAEPERLNADLNLIPGVVETGLFCGIAASVIVGREDGTVSVIGDA
jgi:ribose 5-phosphate isomerase A